jgi:hypothetical protein
VDLGTLARAVAVELGRRGRPVEVIAEPDCVVLGDEEIVQPVLMNLVDNAYRHGAPPVSIRIEHRDDRVVISVEDRGAGVPEDRRESVFAGLPPAGTQGPRAGAGLSIVRGVVAALRGTLWVDDVPEGGAAFRIALPADAPSWTTPAADPELQILEMGPTPPRDSYAAAFELSALASDEDEPRLDEWGTPIAAAVPATMQAGPPAVPPMPGA